MNANALAVVASEDARQQGGGAVCRPFFAAGGQKIPALVCKPVTDEGLRGGAGVAGTGARIAAAALQRQVVVHGSGKTGVDDVKDVAAGNGGQLAAQFEVRQLGVVVGVYNSAVLRHEITVFQVFIGVAVSGEKKHQLRVVV